MADLNFMCMSATTFSKTGEFDEPVFRQFLRRVVDARVGLLVGSTGNGEGHALTMNELRRVYEVAVEECKGKVPVHANLPEQHIPHLEREHLRNAIDAGIEVAHVYQVPGWHGMRPTDQELNVYFDDVLDGMNHPVAVCVNPTMGYLPKSSTIAAVCRRHPQVVCVRLANVPDSYLIDLKEMIDRQISFCMQFASGNVSTLTLGATMLHSAEANLIPRTCRQFLDLYESNRKDELARVYADITHLSQYVMKWQPAGARWIKMAFKVLKLPGGEGGLRKPYLMPEDSELQRFTDGLLRLRIPEVDELARAAGLSIPG